MVFMVMASTVDKEDNVASEFRRPGEEMRRGEMMMMEPKNTFPHERNGQGLTKVVVHSAWEWVRGGQ